jgi:hypothetical protein
LPYSSFSRISKSGHTVCASTRAAILCTLTLSMSKLACQLSGSNEVSSSLVSVICQSATFPFFICFFVYNGT